jgi:hypothetical protein
VIHPPPGGLRRNSDRRPPRQPLASRDRLVRSVGSVRSIDPASPIRPLSPEPPPWPPWPPPWPPPFPSPPSPLSPPPWPRQVQQAWDRGRVSRWCRAELPNLNHGDDQEGSHATLPAVRGGPITIVFGIYPLVLCSGCGARWTQGGSEQPAIKRVQEPALFALARRWRPARWQRHSSTLTSRHRPVVSQRTLPW